MMMIRNERATDRVAIRGILEAAFARPDEANLVDRLREDGDCVLSLVAVESERIVGQVLFSRLRAPFRALCLAPVAVAPDRQRMGIGSHLIRAGLEHAQAAGWQGVFVLGDPRYYCRFGFNPDLARALPPHTPEHT